MSMSRVEPSGRPGNARVWRGVLRMALLVGLGSALMGCDRRTLPGIRTQPGTGGTSVPGAAGSTGEGGGASGAAAGNLAGGSGGSSLGGAPRAGAAGSTSGGGAQGGNGGTETTVRVTDV